LFASKVGMQLIPILPSGECKTSKNYLQKSENCRNNLPLLLSLRSRGNLPLERSEKENASASETKEWGSYPIQEFRVYPRLLFLPKGSNDKTAEGIAGASP
jgi:hypothetical protein